MAARASTPGGRTRSWRCAATSRCSATTARSWRSASRLLERLLAERPDAFIGVDAPDFNLGLEARLKAAGIKTVHFVSPSIWAWRGGGSAKIGRAADLVLCLFPFEPAIYAGAASGDYVGHPLADAIPMERRARRGRAALGVGADETVVALLPGSRRSEIKYIAPACSRRGRDAAAPGPGCASWSPVVPGLRPLLEALRAARRRLPITLLDGHAHEALAACDVALVASGTATLEAALFKRPMVIAYLMHSLSWQMSKLMHYQPWVGLPNILCVTSPCPSCCRTTRRRRWPRRARLARRSGAAGASQARFDGIHRELQRDTARSRPAMPRSKALSLTRTDARANLLGPQAARHRRRRGADGRRRRGRPRAARRPVVAAAVILDEQRTIRGLADSKLLTPDERERLDREIRRRPGAASASPGERRGDRHAEHPAGDAAGDAARRGGLGCKPQIVLVDGNQRPRWRCRSEAVVGGDAPVRSISAASIVAKVHRDRLCCSCTRSIRNTASSDKGSRPHLSALQLHGACPSTGAAFAPVREALDRCSGPQVAQGHADHLARNPLLVRLRKLAADGGPTAVSATSWLEGEHLARRGSRSAGRGAARDRRRRRRGRPRLRRLA